MSDSSLETRSDDLMILNQEFFPTLVSHELNRNRLPPNFKLSGTRYVPCKEGLCVSALITINMESGYFSYGIRAMNLVFSVKHGRTIIHLYLMEDCERAWKTSDRYEDGSVLIGHPLYSDEINSDAKAFTINKDTPDYCIKCLNKHLTRGDKVFRVPYLHSLTAFKSLNFEVFQTMMRDMNKQTFTAYKPQMRHAMNKVLRSVTPAAKV